MKTQMSGQFVSDSAWHTRLSCKVHLDLHCPEWNGEILSRIDPACIARRVRETGAGSLYFFAKDHYGNAYYDTIVGHRHACIGDRDLLSEVVEACHHNDIRVIAYCSVIWDNHCAASHPGWCMRSPEGDAIVETTDGGSLRRWHYLCHNSPYVEYIRRMLAEIATRYEVDGFHLDMFNMSFKRPSCYCETCRELFRSETGWELPASPSRDEVWRQFVAFRYDTVAHCQRELVGAVRDIRPSLFVSTNYHGSPGFDWRVGQLPVRHSLASTINTGETYTPVFGDLYPGLEGRFLESIDPSKGRELVCWRMNRITDYTVKPLPQWRWEALTSLAHGCSVMVIDQPHHDGRLDEVAYERMAQVFGEYDAKRELAAGAPLRHVALYYSSKTRDRYALEHPDRFQQPMIGAYKALVESHFNVGFVFDEQVDDERLAVYPIVILPDVAVMDSDECAMFERYVEQGGTLVATCRTSLFSGTGQQENDFHLGELFGVRLDGMLEDQWHYARGMGDVFGRGIDDRTWILSPGGAVRVTGTTARGFGHLHRSFFSPEPPDRFYSHSVHPPYRRECEAVYLNVRGKGRAIYLPWPVDSAYGGDHELPEHRMLLRNVVASAGHRPAVEVVAAPGNVEVVVRCNGRQIIVHLLSFHATRQAVVLNGLDDRRVPSPRMDEPFMYRATLAVNMPFGAIRSPGSATTFHVEGGEISVIGEDVHESLVIELQ